MKSKFAKQVRKLFSEGLCNKYPMFRVLGPNETKDIISPATGCRLYLWTYAEELYFYLMLYITPKTLDEAFTVECAYTKHKMFPISTHLMFPFSIPRSDIMPSVPYDGNMRFRIGSIFEDRKDYWWWVVPPYSFEEMTEWSQKPPQESIFMEQKISDAGAFKNITIMVDDAISKIREYVIPYFEKVIEDYDNHPDYWNQFKPEDIETTKKRLLEHYGGEIDKKCIWKDCNNKRLKKVVYCVEHLPEFKERK